MDRGWGGDNSRHGGGPGHILPSLHGLPLQRVDEWEETEALGQLPAEPVREGHWQGGGEAEQVLGWYLLCVQDRGAGE